MAPLRERPRLLTGAALGLMLVLAATTGAIATTFVRSGTVKAMKVATADSVWTDNNTTFADLPGMTVTLSVPSGQQAIFLLTFSASTTCIGSGGARCEVQALLVGKGAMVPGVSRFDTAPDPSGPALQPTAHSMQFLAGPYGGGQYTFKVQERTDGPGTYFEIWTRTVSVIRAQV